MPKTHQSSEHIWHGHTHRNGNLYLKWAFLEAAYPAKRVDPNLARLYNRLSRKKGSSKAIVAVARRLAISVFYVLAKGEMYKYRRPMRRAFGKPESLLATYE